MNIFFVIGIIFCALMIKLISNSNFSLNNSEEFYVVLVCISFFGILILGSLYYLLKTQILTMTKENLVLSYLFFPYKIKVKFDEIKQIRQISKEVKTSGTFFSEGIHLTNSFETYIDLENGKVIKTFALNKYEFQEVLKLLRKLKTGEGKLNSFKLPKILFLIENISAILFIIIFLVIVSGLSYNLLFK